MLREVYMHKIVQVASSNLEDNVYSHLQRSVVTL